MNPLLAVRHLQKQYADSKTQALQDIDFDLYPGETLGIIGESGCGKSTTAKLILKLIKADSGEILFENRDITTFSKKETTAYRRQVQTVFQDPYASLHPHKTVFEIISEPLTIHKLAKNKAEKLEKVTKILEQVELSPDLLHQYPGQLSGGQRQRVSIGRTLILEPKLLIADEPTSMLDMSLRSGILNILKNASQARHMSMVFITHDIMTAGYLCHRIAVMYRGKIVETGTAQQVLTCPIHPYTKALVKVATDLSGFLQDKSSYLQDESTYFQDNLTSFFPCDFSQRCVHQCPNCSSPPPWQDFGDGHFALCHLQG